jgi:peptidoglycan/LPS O-acetylase OafA/YrhL
MNRSAPPHLVRLDLLRGAAIVGVLLFHCYYHAFNSDPLPFHGMWRSGGDRPVIEHLIYPLTLGWTGISLFFVLSGFVIHYSRLRADSFQAGNFFWRRFWRIYPTYLVALCFFTALQYHRSGWDAHLQMDFLTHALAVHNFFESTYFGINPSFWTLAVEIQFYLLYPVVLLIRHRWGINKMLLAALAVSVVTRIICYTTTDWSRQTNNVLWGSTAALWFDWVLGVYLAERFFQGKRVFKRPLLTAVFFAALFVAMDSYKPTSQVCITIASLFSAVVIESAVFTTAPVSRITAVASRFGLWSYSFYLWHQPLIPIIRDKLHINRLQSPVERFALLAVASLLLVSLLSYASYLLIEKPTQRFGRRKLRLPSPPAPSVRSLPDNHPTTA